MNKMINDHLKWQNITNTIDVKGIGIKDCSFVHKFLTINPNLTKLKEVDLSHNLIDKHHVSELCYLIEMEGNSIERLKINDNNLGSDGLQHVCSSMVCNKSILYLNIENNNVEDASYKVLYSLFQKNKVISELRYSLTDKENQNKREKFAELLRGEDAPEDLNEWLECHQNEEHSHAELNWKQKVCLPLWCWKSFIHDKHEAFRFKYDTEKLNTLEEKMGKITFLLYLNSFIYYIIMFVCPFVFVNECGFGLSLVSHMIYGLYSISTIVLELAMVLWIQNKLKSKQLLKFNKWHVVELFMGQIARFDTYLDVCFLSMLWQCSQWNLAVPVGLLIVIYIMYPLYSMYKLSGYGQSDENEFKHTQPVIERCCKLSFIRENMLLATVLDSFCIINNTKICKKTITFGRTMGIWTLLTQDGPQYLIHLLFMFFIHTDISHSDVTVITSLIVSSFAIQISIFNIIMCTPNEFNPIVLQVELERRQKQNQKRKDRE